LLKKEEPNKAISNTITNNGGVTSYYYPREDITITIFTAHPLLLEQQQKANQNQEEGGLK
jgi:hypothetical protein